MSDRRELCRWGGSIGFRIPNQIFQQTQFHEGDQVQVTVEDANTVKLERIPDDGSDGESS